MAQGKLVRLFEDGKDFVRFQVTGELKTPQWLQYSPESMLWLDKSEGTVGGTDQQLAEWLQDQLEETAERRNSGDVNRVLLRVCEDYGRLLSVKHLAGVYLALPRDGRFLSRLGRLVTACGGVLRRWPVDHRNPIAATSTADVIARAELTREEGDEMLPVAAQDDWPESVLREQLAACRATRVAIEDATERLHQQYARLGEHADWLRMLITQAQDRDGVGVR